MTRKGGSSPDGVCGGDGMQALTCWYSEQLESRCLAATPGKGRGQGGPGELLASPLGKLGLTSPPGQRPRRGAAGTITSPLGKMVLGSPAASPPKSRARGKRGARVLFAGDGDSGVSERPTLAVPFCGQLSCQQHVRCRYWHMNRCQRLVERHGIQRQGFFWAPT